MTPTVRHPSMLRPSNITEYVFRIRSSAPTLPSVMRVTTRKPGSFVTLVTLGKTQLSAKVSDEFFVRAKMAVAAAWHASLSACERWYMAKAVSDWCYKSNAMAAAAANAEAPIINPLALRFVQDNAWRGVALCES